jgi:hypothetical protein
VVKKSQTILQIVPKIPGELEGVGDYALTIARKLRERFTVETVFGVLTTSFVPGPGRSNPSVEGFNLVALEHLLKPPFPEFDQPNLGKVLLHYVNYGFQKRGVPFRLLSILRGLRRRQRGRLVTIFHELYASGPPWTSAFWLQPVQIRLAKSVAHLSDSCIVSSDNSGRELKRLVPDAHIELHPVPSGIGEPSLSQNQIAGRDPHRWAIFGGTALVGRSLRSFYELFSGIPASIAPRKLFVLGGDENPATRSLLADLVRMTNSPDRTIECDYRPRVAASEASTILQTCSFAWFNYFHRPDVETTVILKSSAFASACAHAVIPIFPHSGTNISIAGDSLPGPFFIHQARVEVPGVAERAEVATKIYDWYQRHVCSEHLIAGIADMFELSAAQ